MTKEYSFAIEQVINFPVEKVFEAWTKPNLLKKWFCPINLKLIALKADIKVGGSYEVSMQDGDDVYIARGVYKEIKKNEKIVFTHGWGEVENSKSVVTVEFASKGLKTKITLRQVLFTSDEDKRGHQEGWLETIENLVENCL
jgi:uncharacterized protein YndB with AHSA1/START domain